MVHTDFHRYLLICLTRKLQQTSQNFQYDPGFICFFEKKNALLFSARLYAGHTNLIKGRDILNYPMDNLGSATPDLDISRSHNDETAE